VAQGSEAGVSAKLQREMEFSLFLLCGGKGHQSGHLPPVAGRTKYQIRTGFTAVWTPERHFMNFGGIYANPAVTGAAVAAVTNRIEIRAGSVVLPLHDPCRVAEEWSMVDYLSQGRVALSFASGGGDVFCSEAQNYAKRKR